MTQEMIGKVLNGRYTITEQIGSGGMAEIYRGQDSVLGRTVAIKIMLPQYAADETFTQRFRQEAAAAANLQSPYIVNIYDWGNDGGIYFIVMELLRGSDLKACIKQHGAINQRKVAEIGAQTCQALAAAHNQDITHRDIKPQNIMVQPDGNIKVMDFGIARAKNTVASKTSAVLGTAHYISPEQAQGKDITAASDIYSLGVVMYEAATGQLPFDGPDAVGVALKQVSEQPIPPSQINPNIDPAFETIILKAMSKDPKARFSTATEMRAALNSYLSTRTSNVAELTDDKTSKLSNKAAGAAGVAGAAAATAVIGNAASNNAYADNGGTSVMPAAIAAQKGLDTPTHDASNFFAPDSNDKISKKEAKKQAAANTNNGKSSKKKIAIIIIAAILALAAAGTAVFLLITGGNKIPDVVGKTQDEATSIIQKAGYEIGTVDEIYSDTIVEGKIISQDPSAGAQKDKGTKINLVISKGKEKIRVPDLNNMTTSEAEEALTRIGLNYRIADAQYSTEYSSGHIMAQNPNAGSQVEKGATVTITPSKGPEMVSVPNVVGMTQNQAMSALNEAGLGYSILGNTYNDSIAEGSVVSQDEQAQASVAKGTTVGLVISKGVEPTVIIDSMQVVGQTVDTARAYIEGLGFKVNTSIASGSYVSGYSPQSGQASKTTINLY